MAHSERERERERERLSERERVANAMQGVPDVRSSGQLTCAGYGSDKRSNAEADRQSPHPHTCYTPAAAASRRSCCSSSSSCHDSHHTHAAAAWAAHAGAQVYFQSALYHHHHHDFSIPWFLSFHSSSSLINTLITVTRLTVYPSICTIKSEPVVQLL